MDDLDYFLNIKQNQIRMVKERGYNIMDELWVLDELLDGKTFKKKLVKLYGKEYPIRRLMFSEYTHTNIEENHKNLVVYYVGLEDSKQIKVDSIAPFIDKMTTEEKDGILVINSILSTAASDRLKIITEVKFQVFNEEELMFNLLNHVLQPKMVLLTVSEAIALKEKFGIKGNKGLPILMSTDPLVRYYQFLPGQIVKIISDYDINMLSNMVIDYAIVV